MRHIPLRGSFFVHRYVQQMAYALRRTAHHLTVVLGPQQTRMIDAEGRWDRHALVDWCTSMVKKDDIVIDVGAHMGLFALVMAAHCHEVYAFEASYPSYQQLCANALVNHAPHVRARHAALGAPGERGARRTLFVQNDVGGASLHQIAYAPAQRKEEVTLQCLDDVVQISPSTRKIGLLKITVEGHEFEVLQGARRIIQDHRPSILFECEEMHHPRVFRFMNDIQYNLTRVHNYPTLFLGTPP